MTEILDLRVTTKIEINASMICPRPADCPIMHIYNAIVGMENYEGAVKIAAETLETQTTKLNTDETLVDCQVEVKNELPCGGMIIRKSLLERKLLLRNTAQKLITE